MSKIYDKLFGGDFNPFWEIKIRKTSDGKSIYEIVNTDGESIALCKDYKYACLCSFAAELISHMNYLYESSVVDWGYFLSKIDSRLQRGEQAQ